MILLAFIPFVWGLGIASAAAILTFKRGAGAMSLGALAARASPRERSSRSTLLPAWIADVAEYNPLAIAIEALRERAARGHRLGRASADDVLVLVPLSVV